MTFCKNRDFAWEVLKKQVFQSRLGRVVGVKGLGLGVGGIGGSH